MQNILDFANYLEMADKQANTNSTYVGHVKRLYRFLKDHGDETERADGRCLISAEMLHSFIQSLCDRGLKRETRNNYVAAFHGYFTFLIKLGRMDADPTPILQYARTRRVAKKSQDAIYTDEQLVRLFRAFGACRAFSAVRSLAFVLLALATGLRVSGLCSLSMDDLPAIQAGEVSVRMKGGDYEDVAVAPFAIKPLLAYVAMRPKDIDTNALFVTEGGAPLRRQQAHDHIAKAQRRAGVRTGIHSFRHTTLSRVNRVGGDAMSRAVACHSIGHVTELYVHTTLEERRQALSSVYRELMEMADVATLLSVWRQREKPVA